jgi:hypothetical protein
MVKIWWFGGLAVVCFDVTTAGFSFAYVGVSLGLVVWWLFFLKRLS